MAGGCLVLGWLMLACASIQSPAMWTPLCKHCHCGESLSSLKPRSVASFVICSRDKRRGVRRSQDCDHIRNLIVFRIFMGTKCSLWGKILRFYCNIYFIIFLGIFFFYFLLFLQEKVIMLTIYVKEREKTLTRLCFPTFYHASAMNFLATRAHCLRPSGGRPFL